MLRVWLPLTKDLRNQGLDDVTVMNNGATFNSSGKLGGCYSFNGSSYITVQDVVLQNIWSYSCWLYSDISSRSWEVVMTCNINGGDADMQLGLYTRPGGNVIQNTANGQYNAGISMTYGQWNHFVGTFDGANLKTYLNGVLVNTKAITNAKLDRPKLTIGARCRGSSYDCYFQGLLNDVRIYDHCLSPMEVKELSKGLILHYPLNRGGWGQENLLKNSGYFTSTTGWTNNQSVTVSVDNNELKAVMNQTTSTPGVKTTTTIDFSAGTYTLSALIKSEGGNRVDIPYPFYLNNGTALYNGVYQKKAQHGDYIYYEATITFSEAKNGTTLYILGSGPNNGETWHIKWVKVERGSIATPWCPNSSDTLATIMDLNGTTEYDCSGFCNNGTRTGTFTWTSNTPKYAVSQVFNGSDNAIQTPNLTTMVTDKNYTIAVWIYKTVIGSKGFQTIYGGPSGFEIEARNGSANETKFVPWNWGKPMASYELNEWNHCVFVHSDVDCKIYLNGEYIATGTAKASNPTGNYFVGAWNTATQQNFDGLMSDFRIYATALSADDVKSLYQNSAYIDSSGNVYGAVHSEA